MTVAAEATAHRSRRRPPRHAVVLEASAPYLLILPVIVVITAILGYPLYKLVTLSFQQYGLAELIQRKGVWIGFDNYRSVLARRGLLAHAPAHRDLHGRERRADDRASGR